MQNFIIETTPRGQASPVKSYGFYGTKNQVLELIDTDPRLQDRSVWYAPAPKVVVRDHSNSFKEAQDAPGILIPLKAFNSSNYQMNWSELIMPVVALGMVTSISKTILHP